MSKALDSFAIFFMILTLARFVDASYVLPYPSLMPGHKLYGVIRIVDDLKRYWYWGNLASYRYSLGQSDKALIEAKTLFEYGQFPLAIAALARSNNHLAGAPQALARAKQEGKVMGRYEEEFNEAMREHAKIITRLLEIVPEEFTWRPEKENPTLLHLHTELTKALLLRR